LEIDLSCSLAWTNLGLEGGGKVNKHFFSESECYLQALINNPRDVDAWISLGCLGGGGANSGVSYTAVQCYVEALKVDPKCATAWANL